MNDIPPVSNSNGTLDGATGLSRRKLGGLSLTALGGLAAAQGVQFESASAATSFKDVTSSTPFHREITWMASKGIAQGWPDGTYRPFEPILRDAFAAFLYRLKGSPAYTPPARSPFKDVTPRTTFYKEIAWCYEKGIFRGWPDGTFRPRNPIWRDAAVVVFYRLAGSPNPGPIADFKDTRSIIFRKEVYWARSIGLMNGWSDGTYRPFQPILRDAAAALFYRYANGGSFGKGISVRGAIAHQYFITSGSLWGPLGRPTAKMVAANGGYKQTFEKGLILFKDSTGAHRVTEPILSLYKAAGEQSGKYGFPVGNASSDGYVVTQRFEGGTITKQVKARPTTGYYIPNDSHSTAFTRGAGAVLKYSTDPNAIVNGTRVRFIWETMRKIGYVGSIPGGSRMTFNVTLRDAVIRFQRRYGLAADGVVGASTWRKMNDYRGTNYPFNMDSYVAPTEASAKGGNAAARIAAMYNYFLRFENRSPYTWGGAGYRNEAWAGFDCSGLVYQMVAAGGIVIESTNPVDHARKNYRSTQSIYRDSRLRTYPLSQRRDGDIITFASTSARRESEIVHDGIFYKGYLLESHSPGVVRTKWNGGDIYRGYYRYVMPKVKRPFA